MNTGFLFWLLFVTFFYAAENARILAILPYPGKSHFVVFKPILEKLAERGHVLDVMSHFPSKKSIARYNDISLEGTMKINTNNINVESLKNTNFIENIKVLFKMAGTDMCKAVLASEQAKNLLNSTARYDLLITQVTCGDCVFGFATVFNIPIVAVTTSVNLPWLSDRMGLEDNPSYIPSYLSSYAPKMGFFERFWNTVVLVTAKILYGVQEEEIQKISKNFFGDKITSIKDTYTNVSLMMVNSHFSIQQSRPIVPNFVEIAGVHIGQDFSVPKHLEKLMNSSNIIYLSFGSMIMTETLPEHILKGMFETFKELPYKVLWKANKDLFPKHLEIPANIQFEKWMPQLGILCHPNTKLFISHGGMLGTQESNYCGVPILGIPIFADQSLNINNNVAKGVAQGLKFNEITKESFSKAVRSLLEPRYKNRAEQISKIFRDRPSSALDTAIYWIEYVIRHNGAPHLKSDALELQWYQYYLLDVISFGLVLVIVTLKILWYLLKKLSLYLMLMFISKKLKRQ